jgi:hypothetical protein
MNINKKRQKIFFEKRTKTRFCLISPAILVDKTNKKIKICENRENRTKSGGK